MLVHLEDDRAVMVEGDPGTSQKACTTVSS
jgi:hypothetical protein